MICGGKNGTNGCHLAAISEDVVFAHHFVAPWPPPTSSASGIGYTSKIQSKMAGNSARYPVYSGHSRHSGENL